VEVLEAANSGDHERARCLFERLLPWLQHMEAGAYNQKVKLSLRHLGLDCGEVRPPLLPLDHEAAAALVDVLDAARR
jgi:dihydrodipicolinate synthase/N-acetylneuraminate lyase